MINVLALREKFEHMSIHSGYDALYHHLPADVAVDPVFCHSKKVYPSGIGRILYTASEFISRSGFYNAQSVVAETRLLARSFNKSYNIIHYTYGESYYGLGSSLTKITKHPVVVTNHQPVSWWQANSTLYRKFNNASQVITLSEHDRDHFNSFASDKAVCIPHGVDTAFYKPSNVPDRNNEQPFTVIFAGRYLRDMVTLAAVVTRLSASNLNIRFDVVYEQKEAVTEPHLKLLINLPKVTWHANITDTKLLNLYQQAHCCLIPLLDCTANNAILEAMACGLPVISTDLPAVKTYVDSSMSVLGRKGNADDLYDAVTMLYHNEHVRKAMSLNAREKAVSKFDWNRIAAQTFNLFKTLR